MARKPLPFEALGEIIRRRQNGERIVDIAKEFGISVSTYYSMLAFRERPYRGRARKVSHAQKNQIIAQSEALQIDKRAIAETYGITRDRVYQIVGPRRKMPRVTPAEIEDMRRLRRAGHSLREIERMTGRSDVTVARYTRDI